MDSKAEIEFLMKLRKEAQELVDKLTLRIVEIQTDKTEKSIGFKK